MRIHGGSAAIEAAGESSEAEEADGGVAAVLNSSLMNKYGKALGRSPPPPPPLARALSRVRACACVRACASVRARAFRPAWACALVRAYARARGRACGRARAPGCVFTCAWPTQLGRHEPARPGPRRVRSAVIHFRAPAAAQRLPCRELRGRPLPKARRRRGGMGGGGPAGHSSPGPQRATRKPGAASTG